MKFPAAVLSPAVIANPSKVHDLATRRAHITSVCAELGWACCPRVPPTCFGVRSELPDALGHAWLASTGKQAMYQAVHDPELTAVPLELMAQRAKVAGLRFAAEPGVTLRSRPIGVEQSNTTLVYGQTYILKLFGRLTAGASIDLQLHRALAAVGCQHIATPLGSIDDGGTATYGMLTEYLRGTADGWAMVTASLRDLLAEGAPDPVEHSRPEDAGGGFASEAHRLGHAVATVHADLATALGSSPAPAGYLDELADRMHHRLAGPVPIQRVHGDLHLGQVLRSVTSRTDHPRLTA